ncbi:MAG: CBS domain-containing protein [Gemmatimonadota bacterium]|nr:CBS domain-containing protein [Gemmatimonadota bacterium]MDH4350556.1 CBS domain-containing protein [Gemmatimonadota bacterium]MDH5198401.1 CBS domain-containing protein [Gemmatimonadota bacterium]
MRLPELLAADRIVLGAPGETVRDVARVLVHAIIASGHVHDPDRLEGLLADALPSEAVTVGQRAFLLHFRTDAVDGVVGALAVTAASVHRQHDPGKASRVVALLLAPSREGATYLRVLGTFARALGRDDVIAVLEAAQTPDDVLNAPELSAVEVPEELLVRDVLTRRLVTVAPETPLIEAARLMVRHGVSALPVVTEENEMLGLVSHGEILQHLLPRHGGRTTGEHPVASRTPRLATSLVREVVVREVMDRSVLCLSEEQSLTEAAGLMVHKKLERVPVVHDGALVGLLTREDLVRRLFGS